MIVLNILQDVNIMLYPFAEFPDELSTTYSQIMTDDNVKGDKNYQFILSSRQIMDLKV